MSSSREWMLEEAEKEDGAMLAAREDRKRVMADELKRAEESLVRVKAGLFPAMAADEAAGRTYEGLREAVLALYDAAYWQADRECEAAVLWEAVRERAGIKPGKSPSRRASKVDQVTDWVRTSFADIRPDDSVVAVQSREADGDIVLTLRLIRKENVADFLTKAIGKDQEKVT